MHEKASTAYFTAIHTSGHGGSEIHNDCLPPDADARGEDVALNFNLKHLGSSPTTLLRSSIPGIQKNAIWISAEYFLDFGKNHRSCPRPLEKIFMEEGLLGTAAIQPGQSMTQTIKLSDRYSNISEILGKCDLVVLWSYKPETDTGDHAERLAGVIVFPASPVSL